VRNTSGKYAALSICFFDETCVPYLNYSSLLAAHDVTRLLDESMTPIQKKELGEAEAVCRRFMAWNLEDFDVDANPSRGGVKARLAEVLRHNSNDEDDGDGDE